MSDQPAPTRPRIVAAGTGERTGPDEHGSADRFLIDGDDAGGRFALVEHTLGPRALAAPLHHHSLEDEYSFVLEGRMGALLGDHEVVAEAGDLVFKPRGQWHTFWNAGDTPTRILEIISPSGLEDLFRRFADGYPEPDVLAAMAAEHGALVDFERTMELAGRHALAF